jgi:hypothetical protein
MRIRSYYDKRSGELKEELIFDRKEQERQYSQCINMVLNDTEFVLEKLEFLPEFKVNWENYKKKKKSL